MKNKEFVPYIRDNETIKFRSRNDLDDYFDYLDREKDWNDVNNAFFPVFSNEISVIAVHNDNEIQRSLDAAEPHFKRLGKYNCKAEPLDLEDPVIAETVAGSGIFLVMPFEKTNRYDEVIPVAECAFDSILARAGDADTVMQLRNNRSDRIALDIEHKADRLAEDFSLMSKIFYARIRDAKLRALLSARFVDLPVEAAIEKLEDQLAADHPEYEFRGGEASHVAVCVQYLLNDEVAEASLKQMLKDAGYVCDAVRLGVQFSTSDVGDGSMKVAAYADVDGQKMFLGGGIEMPHYGEASIEKFEERLPEIGNMVKEADERIEQLCNMDLKDPAKVLVKVYEIKKKSGTRMLRKDIVEEVAQNMAPGPGTGIDVFVALNECATRRRTMERMGASEFLRLSEFTSDLMYLPFDLIEKGQYVERG